jgi:hypothetical protein
MRIIYQLSEFGSYFDWKIILRCGKKLAKSCRKKEKFWMKREKENNRSQKQQKLRMMSQVS